MEKQVFGWVEIAVSDMDRAIKFYESVFGFTISRNKMGELDMCWFPWSENPEAPGAGGSLVYHKDFYKPAQNGTLVYFNSPSGDLNNELAKVEKAGGKILAPKKQISPEHGYMGLFIDSEGNRIALHSRN
jgi:uncharacterized protein